MKALIGDRVTVWTDPQGVPERFVWGETRYRVIDRPTRVESDYDLAAMHPPAIPLAWRFTAKPDDGGSLIFDVRPIVGRDEWVLIRVYE
jgi:hypothetical protein